MISEPPITILGSSSSGNCALVQTAEAKVLIDAGFSGKRICQMLSDISVRIEEIDAVFLTHEHADHTQGFRGLYRYQNLIWISNKETFESIAHPNKNKARWNHFETGNRFSFKDLEIDTFSIPHDAADPVGFTFSWGGNDLFSPHHNIAWVLDLGHMTSLVRDKISKATTLVIEANYDQRLLEEDTKRPWSVKQRILSRHGHLSNTAVAEYLHSDVSPHLDHILSQVLNSDIDMSKASCNFRVS